MTTTPRIYVACLASYNAGHLFGEWIDVDCDAEDLADMVSDMLSRSPYPNAEEWRIDAHEGFGFDPSGSFESIVMAAEAIEAHGPVFGAAVNYFGSVCYALQHMEHYRGSWDSMSDYAHNFADECDTLSQVPEQFRYHIDWDSYAQALDLISFDMRGKDGLREIHIFTRC